HHCCSKGVGVRLQRLTFAVACKLTPSRFIYATCTYCVGILTSADPEMSALAVVLSLMTTSAGLRLSKLFVEAIVAFVVPNSPSGCVPFDHARYTSTRVPTVPVAPWRKVQLRLYHGEWGSPRSTRSDTWPLFVVLAFVTMTAVPAESWKVSAVPGLTYCRDAGHASPGRSSSTRNSHRRTGVLL